MPKPPSSRLRKTYKREVKAFVKVCRRLAKHMYVTGYGGNLAWKLEEDLLLVTPTQRNKGDVRRKDVVFVNLAGEVVEGSRAPTGELPMYLKFFNDRPDIVSVVHCHPPHVCAMAISAGQNWLMRPLYPETTTEVGPVPVVPYALPLTQELADNFEPYLQTYNSFIMENHGLVTMSRGDIRWTLMNVEVLEATAQSVILALQMGGGIKELSLEDVRRLGQVMGKRNLSLFGAPGANASLEGMYFDGEGAAIWT
jgi:L-fuculose-phosphate aldolase